MGAYRLSLQTSPVVHCTFLDLATPLLRCGVVSWWFSGSKYCPMLVKESGVVMLQDLLTAYQHQRSPLHDDHIAQLALKVISRCERFDVDTDYVTDDEQESDIVNQ